MAQGLKAGTLLDHGKYRIERILGPGGFGITYLATDLGLDKQRAIKEFFPKDYCDRNETTSHVILGTSNTSEFVDKLKKKFIKEARNIANLDQHQGIITIHAVFEENNTAYYVMDYIEGENLSSMVKKDGPLPVEKAIKYITDVGNALEYVHQHHINHLDIKPANIMIRRKDDMPILIDFGLSKQYDSEGLQTSTTPTGISHGYAPIEQYNDGGVKEFYPQTDVYSLAATLYYLVSGKVPPHATSLTQNDLTFPEGFPFFLKEPISKAMSTKRGHRHETVKDFISSLHAKDEATIIEVPKRSGNLPTSENDRGENIHVSVNNDGNLSSSHNQSDNKPGSRGNKNKVDKTRGRRKYNFPAYIKKHKNVIMGFCLSAVITGALVAVSFSKSKKVEKINNFIVEWSENISREQRNSVKDLINSMVLVEGGFDIHKYETRKGDFEDLLMDDDKWNKAPIIMVQDSTEIETFYISKFEVTQELWKAIMNNNPSINKNDKAPVTNVSIEEIKEFINKLNQISNLKFRLPELDEWEFAYKGGNYTKDLIFSGSNEADEVAWFKNNSNGVPKMVGEKKPNELGIYDMEGNISEWVFKPVNSRGNFTYDPRDEYGNYFIMGTNWSSELSSDYYYHKLENDYNYFNNSHHTKYVDKGYEYKSGDDDMRDEKSGMMGFRLALSSIYDKERKYQRPRDYFVNEDAKVVDATIVSDSLVVF